MADQQMTRLDLEVHFGQVRLIHFNNPKNFDGITGSNIANSCWLFDYSWQKRFKWQI